LIISARAFVGSFLLKRLLLKRPLPFFGSIEILEAPMGEFLMDLWAFMKERKKFWLFPIIIWLVLLGGLIVLTSGSAVAPFIYTLF
jgi:hypothetical protein